MTERALKTISIQDLVTGMYVHQIAEQSGKVKIKSQGKVTQQAVVDTLKAKGVKTVIIDQSKAFDPAPSSPAADAAEPEPEPVQRAAKPEYGSSSVRFEDELSRAQKLHKQGKSIQKQLLNAVQKGLPFDDTIPREFSHKLVASIDRNPDALLCLTKIREKDDYLLEHSLNVAILLANFGRFIGMDEDQVNDLAHAGFLHDIGKIRIPDSILHKPGRLTDMEMNIMRDHVFYGVQALEEENIPAHLIRTVSEHHERLDGYGYPNGSRGEEISQAGRMLAIADMYDALTADRCYKPGMPSQRALQILVADSPHKLDKALVLQFIKCMGVYPVGSIVLLSNERLAVVTEQTDNARKPKIRVFYSARNNHYLELKDIDLTVASNLKIEKAVQPGDYNIDVQAFFERVVNQ